MFGFVQINSVIIMLMQFGSLITAMVTPFKDEAPEQVDYVACGKLIEHLVLTGSDSIVVAGTTGESPTLSHDEELELLKFSLKKVAELGKGTKIIFGAGSNSTATAIKYSQKAEELGADALLHVTPYYNKPNSKGLKLHFSSIAEATKLPIMLYNIPGRSVINIQAKDVIELAQKHRNIVALKEASNNIDQISAIRQKLSNEEFQLYSGDDSLTLPMLAVGADGVVSVASHLQGAEMKEMINSFKSGDIAKAQQIHAKLFPLFVALFNEPNPSCVKQSLGIIGMCSAKLRAPLAPLSAEQVQELKDLLASLEIHTVAAV